MFGQCFGFVVGYKHQAENDHHRRTGQNGTVFVEVTFCDLDLEKFRNLAWALRQNVVTLPKNSALGTYFI